MALFSPELMPLAHDLRHIDTSTNSNMDKGDEDSVFDDHNLDSNEAETNLAKTIFDNKIKDIPNSSFNSVPSQMGPLIQLPEEKVRILPRHKRMLENVNMAPKPRLSRTKYRKKVKFRLIPTFKNLENGHFVGRTEDIKFMRRLLMNSKRYFKDESNTLVQHNALSILALTGPNSVGKSSLAYLYLMTYEERYKYVFWINANSILSDVRDILLYHLGNKYEVQSIKSEKSAEIIRTRFMHYLKTLSDDFLLVFDDFNNAQVNIYDWIPTHLENTRSDTLSKISVGHVVLTTNLLAADINVVLNSFQTNTLNIEMKPLNKETIVKYFNRELGMNNTDEDSLLKLMDEENLGKDIFTLKLLNMLRIQANSKWDTFYAKFRKEQQVVRFAKVEKLKNIFKNVRDNELRAKKEKQKYFSRERVMEVLSRKKKAKIVNLMDLDGFNSDLFEVELILQKFKLTKYFPSLVDLGMTSLHNLAEVSLSEPSTYYWRKSTYLKKQKRFRKKKTLPFDLKDEVLFFRLTKYVQRQTAQKRTNIVMKLWLDFLSTSNLAFHVKVFDILKQISWLSGHRVPLFLFPELLLEEKDEVYYKDGQSTNSSSTITHNSHTLSSLSLNIQVDTKINGSTRFSCPELEFLEQKNYLNFFVSNGLLKVEKTGFISMNPLIKHAIMTLEEGKESSFDVILSLVRKIHIIGFEFNFDDIVGESLSLLRNNPKLVQNSYNQTELKFIESLSDIELQTFCTHDFNLKLNMIPHFEFVRKQCFKELLASSTDLKKYVSKCTASRNDLFGIRHKQVKDFNKYLRMVTNSDGLSLFNASRASLFPEFSSRDLALVRADIIFNEGLFILNIPFRQSRFVDAFSCFKTSYNMFTKVLSNKRFLNGRDLTMAKCCFHMAEALMEIESYVQAVEMYELALKHFHDFHGEFTNHPDTARTLSRMAVLYHRLALLASRKESLPSVSNLKVTVKDIINSNEISSECLTMESKENADIDVEQLISFHDVDKFAEEALQHHQLSLQMYMDILGKKPLNAAFAKSLAARADTLFLLGDLEEAQQDLIDAMNIFETLCKTAPIYNRQVGDCAMRLAQVCCEKEEGLHSFMQYLNQAMLAYSSLSDFEIKLLQPNEEVATAETTLMDIDIEKLSPHAALSDCLVEASRILLDCKKMDYSKNAKVLLQAAYVKYKEIFPTFKHPRIKAVKEKLKAI